MTFLKLIQANEIVIPLIQRDYAQGRKEENFKAEAFLNAIYKGTKSNLNLDFIYGKIDRKKKTFLPLDGQQRLTTLLLIYWFISLEKNHIVELEKFTYEVRSSTKDFIKKITKEENWKKLSKNNIVKNIENSNWFFLSWKRDPSVQAILNMLNLIEKKFQNVDISDLKNITFEFLNLDEFNLTDELYVKMNARGKPLSDFDNFKAEFSKLLKTPLDKAKLDNKWLDIFWSIGQHEAGRNLKNAPKLADEKYYNFFYNVTYNFYVEKFPFEKNELKDKNLFSFYEKVYSLPNILNHLLKVLNALDRKEEIFIAFIRKIDISYVERAKFYALSLAYINGLDKSKKEFNDWLRVSLNLINNQRIDDAKDFKNIIMSLNTLSSNESIHNIYSYIANKPDNISSFNQIQREEEALKSALILKDNNWEKEFIKAEAHWYLNGQIGFLLKFSANDLSKFIDYRNKFLVLFDKEKIDDGKKYQTLIHRALLTFDDYLPKHRNKYTFCSYGTDLREKGENWRQVFNKGYFQSLLDDDRNLETIVNDFSFDCNDWRSYFINPAKDWEVISYANHFQLEKNNKNIYLNRGNVGVTRWSWRRVVELYSYYLYKESFENKTFTPFTEVWYWQNSSPDEEKPCIVMRGLERYEIDIYFKNNEFYIDFLDRDKKELPQKIIDVLEKSTFEREDRNYNKKVSLCNKIEIVTIIKKLSKDLEEIKSKE